MFKKVVLLCVVYCVIIGKLALIQISNCNFVINAFVLIFSKETSNVILIVFYV